MSTVLLGQRRMGKTEIFKRVVNRLFFEQDYQDPKAVVPVYYSFRILSRIDGILPRNM
jgi:AAA+ ATPase superfamily predicted ATPase